MDDVVMKLPLRLTPRKLGAVLRGVFFLFFFCFSIFWIVMAATGVMNSDLEDEPFPSFRYAFPAFGVPFVLIGFFGLANAAAKLLPGSPYHHVEISPGGIKIRRGRKTQRADWKTISPFGVSVKTRSTKGGKVSTYWVVALRAGDERYLAAEKDRYNRSILQINTGDYVNEKADEAARAMADWLNGIRAEAVDRPGRAIAITTVPPDFRAVAREMAGARGVQAAPANRSSVIER